jgi:uncharacterized membrane protein
MDNEMKGFSVIQVSENDTTRKRQTNGDFVIKISVTVVLLLVMYSRK